MDRIKELSDERLITEYESYLEAEQDANYHDGKYDDEINRWYEQLEFLYQEILSRGIINQVDKDLR